MNELTNAVPTRFLIGQLARYGDCLYATTIAKQIKKDHPGSHITWAIATNFRSILVNNPFIDEVWEVPINDGDYYARNWDAFKQLALQRKQAGDFDQIIFSQVNPDNFIHYTGTIRGTILDSYKKNITVPVSPVLILSDSEVQQVKQFADEHQLNKYEHVILFECNPGSGQSAVNIEFAMKVAKSILNEYNNTCFILTSQHNDPGNDPRIVNAASLSFRENAELTKYCTLFVGCSSGITWLATSEWAKQLPMLQLFSKKPSIYAGVHHDFAINGLNNEHIIEIADDAAAHAAKVLTAMMNNDLQQVKKQYHQNNIPKYRDFKKIVEQLVKQSHDFRAVMNFAKQYNARSSKDGAPLNINFSSFAIQLRLTQLNRALMNIVNPIKRKFKSK